MEIDRLRTAQRVLIIGSPGAGKSTLARALARTLNLPLFHLDQLKWQPGWVELPDEQFRQRLGNVVAGDRWLIDGNYGGSLSIRLARADLVIWLDFPTWLCLFRAVRRILTYRGTTRPDMTPGCPERFDLDFLVYIGRFRAHGRGRLLSGLAGYRGTVLQLTKARQVARLLAGGPVD